MSDPFYIVELGDNCTLHSRLWKDGNNGRISVNRLLTGTLYISCKGTFK